MPAHPATVPDHPALTLGRGVATRIPPQPIVDSFDDALSILSAAATARIADQTRELERLRLIEAALADARAAGAALHIWSAQCLSEYRGSRTTWDLRKTGELLGAAVAQFRASARDTARRLAVLMPEFRAAQQETRQEATGPSPPASRAV
jgi:hypothetical protein